MGFTYGENVKKVSRRSSFNKGDHFTCNQVVEAVELNVCPLCGNCFLQLNRSIRNLKVKDGPPFAAELDTTDVAPLVDAQVSMVCQNFGDEFHGLPPLRGGGPSDHQASTPRFRLWSM